MNLFGRPRNVAAKPQQRSTPDIAEAIKKLRSTIDTLDKREQHIDKKIRQQLLEAKQKMAAKDKRGALFCLKRKKMFEGEIEKITGARLTLEQQVLALETSAMNMQTFAAMNEGRQAMRQARGNMDADTVGETLDDIRDEIAENNEISSVIGAPLEDAAMEDEELLAELNEFEQLEIEEKLLSTPSVPVSEPTTAAADLPDLPVQPTSAIQVDQQDVEGEDLAALRELEASMMAA